MVRVAPCAEHHGCYADRVARGSRPVLAPVQLRRFRPTTIRRLKYYSRYLPTAGQPQGEHPGDPGEEPPAASDGTILSSAPWAYGGTSRGTAAAETWSTSLTQTAVPGSSNLVREDPAQQPALLLCGAYRATLHDCDSMRYAAMLREHAAPGQGWHDLGLNAPESTAHPRGDSMGESDVEATMRRRLLVDGWGLFGGGVSHKHFKQASEAMAAAAQAASTASLGASAAQAARVVSVVETQEPAAAKAAVTSRGSTAIGGQQACNKP
jgi:hypothetical protein